MFGDRRQDPRDGLPGQTRLRGSVGHSQAVFSAVEVGPAVVRGCNGMNTERGLEC